MIFNVFNKCLSDFFSKFKIGMTGQSYPAHRDRKQCRHNLQLEDPSLIPDPIKNPGALEHLDTGDKTEFFHDIIMSYNTDRDECDQIKNRELVNDTEIKPRRLRLRFDR